ncbi:MAG: DUF433 domain-containing protein [Acidobacteria bacterium]|nr:DUF433 domain-containing protein [Acidobacteriota bacterium]
MATVIETFPKPVKRDKHGVLRVGNSRVSLDGIVRMFNDGSDAAEIQYNYNTLSLAEVFGAISYYLHNKERIDAYLKRREVEIEKMREQNRLEFPPKITREMLLARKTARTLIGRQNKISDR